ncbi:hypothetical protein [Kitasatospora acidiphila]
MSLVLELGDHGNAWLAVGRAMAEAERSADPHSFTRAALAYWLPDVMAGI